MPEHLTCCLLRLESPGSKLPIKCSHACNPVKTDVRTHIYVASIIRTLAERRGSSRRNSYMNDLHTVRSQVECEVGAAAGRARLGFGQPVYVGLGRPRYDLIRIVHSTMYQACLSPVQNQVSKKRSLTVQYVPLSTFV